MAEEDAGSEACEWELREPRGREEERRVAAEELGDGGEEQPLVLPFMATNAGVGCTTCITVCS